MTPEANFPPPKTAQNDTFAGSHDPMTTFGYGDFFSASNSANFLMDGTFMAQMGANILPGGATAGVAVHSATYTPVPLSVGTIATANQNPVKAASKSAILAEIAAAKQLISLLETRVTSQEVAVAREVASVHVHYDQKMAMLRQELLNEIATVRVCVDEVKAMSAAVGGDEDDEGEIGVVYGAGGVDGEVRRKKEASTAAFNDTTLKSVVRQSFQRLLGVAKLTAAAVPWWPKEGEEWPVDASTNERRLRFRWEEAAQHVDNYASIQKIVTYIRQNGPAIEPAVATPLADISERDLEQRVIKKFQDLQKTLRSAGKLASNRHVKVEEPGGEGLGVEENKDEKKGLTKAMRQSRARGKVDVRVRKLDALPAESLWKDPKYRPALVETMMSDDEDELDGNGKKTGRFISRAPEWRSQTLQEFLDAIDKGDDPNGSNRYVTRIRGELKPGLLPATKKLENKARRWMVSPEWLNEPQNQKYDTAAFLLDNGRAWGDPKDPEEMLAGQKRVKDEKREIAANKRMRLEENGEQSGKKTGGKKKIATKKMSGGNGEGIKDGNAPVVPQVASSSKVTLDDDEFSEDEN